MDFLVGYVVPTLGVRINYLERCLNSIRDAGIAEIVVVAPSTKTIANSINSTLYDHLISDPGHGLCSAIELGFLNLSPSIRYMNWLGDDDLITPSSLSAHVEILERSPNTVLTYGKCEYLSSSGTHLFTNISGGWAPRLMQLGPQLVSQPAVLFRRETYILAGGLDSHYKLAFDLDLFIRFHKLGEFKYIPKVLGKFTWHQDSLSVKQRQKSVAEASEIRKRSHGRVLRTASFLWEPVLRILIFFTGSSLTVISKCRQ